jgi:hypothetical protein
MVVEYVDAYNKRHLYSYPTTNLPVQQLPTLLAEATSTYKVKGYISFYIETEPKGAVFTIPHSIEEVPSMTLFRIITNALSIATNLDRIP